MMTVKNISLREREVLKGVVDVLKKHLDPGQIILFGSRAKREYNSNSDFDLAVDKERTDIRLRRKVKEDIEKISGLYSVDIIFLNSVDQAFKEIVLKTGKVIYERRS